MSITEAVRKKCIEKFEKMLSDSNGDGTLSAEAVIEYMKAVREGQYRYVTAVEQRWKYSNNTLMELPLGEGITESNMSDRQYVFYSYWWDEELKKAFIDVSVRDPLVGAIGSGFVYDIVNSGGAIRLENEELMWIS